MAVKKINKKIKAKKPKKTKIPAKVLKYLEKTGINHEILEHRTVYTAIDAALTLKRKLNEIAKSLLIKADKNYYLALLPADFNLDFKKLAKCIGAQNKKQIKVVKIPGEKAMENLLKIKLGSMSAFGSLYKLPVVMEKKLVKTKKVIFSAGSLNHSIEMKVKDFISLENVILGTFGIKKKVKLTSTIKKKKATKKHCTKKKSSAKKNFKNKK